MKMVGKPVSIDGKEFWVYNGIWVSPKLVSTITGLTRQAVSLFRRDGKFRSITRGENVFVDIRDVASWLDDRYPDKSGVKSKIHAVMGA